jgi:tRNA G10  N-methylase Trm11
MVHELAPDLVNDPRESTWDVVVDDAGPVVKLELVPRGYDDERFAWRKELVSASSHPVIAAALARVAPRRDDDVVWDPFVGAGAELVERARLGPYARLIGTDIDARAVAAARSNIARAGVERATIERADACEQAPEGVTLVLTNPPMGRRVERGRHADLLERFVAHAARVLVPGGALVWLVPEPGRVRTRAATEGLDLRRAFTVDMGGFPAELSIFVKRVAPEPRRRVVSPKAKAGTPKAR